MRSPYMTSRICVPSLCFRERCRCPSRRKNTDSTQGISWVAASTVNARCVAMGQYSYHMLGVPDRQTHFLRV